MLLFDIILRRNTVFSNLFIFIKISIILIFQIKPDGPQTIWVELFLVVWIKLFTDHPQAKSVNGHSDPIIYTRLYLLIPLISKILALFSSSTFSSLFFWNEILQGAWFQKLMPHKFWYNNSRIDQLHSLNTVKCCLVLWNDDFSNEWTFDEA